MLQVDGGMSADPELRRRHVVRLLEERRLLLGARALRSVSERADDRDTFIARLATACFELGPVFAAFGRYLGSRADLLSAAEAFQLQAIPVRETKVTSNEIADQLREELGDDASELTPHLEPEGRTRGLIQEHRAVLPDGRRLCVRLVTRQRLARLESEIELLEVLRPAFAKRDLLGGSFDRLLDAFRRDLDSRLDLAARAAALEVWGQEARTSGLLRVASVQPRLCSRRVLTTATIDAEPLADTLQTAEPQRARQFALRAATIWLRQALTSAACPVELDLGVDESGDLALFDGHFTTLPQPSRANLWGYLRATSAHDPDRAFTCIEREIEALSRDPQRRFELRQRLRQAVPFRDGSWTPEAGSLSENLMLHWRYLELEGFRARPHLVDVYRGIFVFATRVERHTERPDLLREALEDLEWSAAWAQIRRLLEPTQIGESLSAAVTLMMALPQRLDHLLDLLDRDQGPPVKVHRSRQDQRRMNRTAAVLALLLALVSVVFLSSHPGIGAALGGAAEVVRTVLFLALAAALLLLIGGRR